MWEPSQVHGGDRTVDSAVQDGLLADAHHWNIQRHDNWWIYREGERDGGREGGKLRMEMFAVVNCYGYGCWEHNVTESCGEKTYSQRKNKFCSCSPTVTDFTTALHMNGGMCDQGR